MSTGIKMLVDLLNEELSKKKKTAMKVHQDMMDFQSRRMTFLAATTPKVYQGSAPLYAIFNCHI